MSTARDFSNLTITLRIGDSTGRLFPYEQLARLFESPEKAPIDRRGENITFLPRWATEAIPDSGDLDEHTTEFKKYFSSECLEMSAWLDEQDPKVLDDIRQHGGSAYVLFTGILRARSFEIPAEFLTACGRHSLDLQFSHYNHCPSQIQPDQPVAPIESAQSGLPCVSGMSRWLRWW